MTSLFSGTLTSPLQALHCEPDFAREILNIDDHRRKLIARRNALYSPIFRLPSDILVIIFHFAQITFLKNFGTHRWVHSRTYSEEGSDPRNLLPVLLVCRQWHAIAMRHPSLWAFVGPGRTAWNPEAARALMERSKSAPLACTLHSRALRRRFPLARRPQLSRSNEVDELRALLQHGARIQHLDLELLGSSYALFAEKNIREIHWRALLTAKFVAILAQGDVRVPEISILRVESLRSLTLQNFYLSHDPSRYSFPALEELCITTSGRTFQPTPVASVLTFIVHTPRLVRLELEGSKTTQWSDMDHLPVANLPRLRQLILQGPRGCDYLEIGRHLVLTPACSLSYFFTANLDAMSGMVPFSGEGSDYPTLYETLNKALPTSAPALLPNFIALEPSTQMNGHGAQMTADFTVGDEDLDHSSPPRADSSRHLLRIDFIVNAAPPPLLPPQPTNLVMPMLPQAIEVAEFDRIQRQIAIEDWKHVRGTDIETLLTRACALTSLVTFACSIAVPPLTLVRALSTCFALTNVRLSGLDAARHFANALTLAAHDPGTAHFLPSLQHIEVDGLSYEWMLAIPSDPEYSRWSVTLFALCSALFLRKEAALKARDPRVKLKSLTLHRGLVGLSCEGMDFMEEAVTITALEELVEELYFSD